MFPNVLHATVVAILVMIGHYQANPKRDQTVGRDEEGDCKQLCYDARSHS